MATANNKRIEESAVNAVKAALLRCPILDAYIDENDKTPSWDGTVFAYKNGEQKKCDLLGRVPVQVKGTENQIISDTASFSCSLVDLRNYYQDGGCIFFLVSTIPATGEHKIFYASLLVYDLKKIIDHADKQKSTTIKLETFPEHNPDEMGNIFLSFIHDYPKQRGFVGKPILSVEDLKAKGVEIDSLSFGTTSLKTSAFNIGTFASTHDFYLYAKPRGLDIEIPVDKISNAIISKIIPIPVSIKGIEYYDHYSVTYKNGTSNIWVGKGISVKLSPPDKKSMVNFRPNGTLSDFIKDATFMVELIKQKEIDFGDVKIPLHDLTEIDTEKYSNSLAYYKDVKKMLDVLGVTEELDCEQLTKNDEVNLRNFVLAVLYNKNIRFPNINDPIIHGPIKIANLSIWIWGIRQESGDYKIENFFEPHSIAAFQMDDNKHEHPLPVSHYVLLDKSAFTHASNINYQAIEDDLLSTKLASGLISSITSLLLEMLRGYDEMEYKRPELLTLAEKTCTWISASEAGADMEIVALNRLQIIKRQRDFSISEIMELGKIIESSQSPNILCGAYLLLDNNESAQRYFEQLEPQNQEEFLTYPICHFGKLTIKQKDSKE